MTDKQEVYPGVIDLIKALSYDMMMGCENGTEFNYLRAASQATIVFLQTAISTNLRVDWVKLYAIIDENTPSTLDPKLIEAMGDYKIQIMDLFQGIEE